MYISPLNEKKISEFDYSRWINKRLTKEDKEQLSKDLNLFDASNRLISWRTIKNMLLEFDFEIVEIRDKNKRLSIILDLENASN